MILRLLAVGLATFVINLPCGWWRAGVRKFSLAWVAAVHLPVPAVVLMRLRSGLGFAWYTYPVMIGAYFGGQFVGARWRHRRNARASSVAEHALSEPR